MSVLVSRWTGMRPSGCPPPSLGARVDVLGQHDVVVIGEVAEEVVAELRIGLAVVAERWRKRERLVPRAVAGERPPAPLDIRSHPLAPVLVLLVRRIVV